MKYDQRIGMNIQRARKTYGLSLTELSSISNVMESALSKAEKGELELFPVELAALASALNVTPRYLRARK